VLAKQRRRPKEHLKNQAAIPNLNFQAFCGLPNHFFLAVLVGVSDFVPEYDA
jgi:hypothetical protein